MRTRSSHLLATFVLAAGCSGESVRTTVALSVIDAHTGRPVGHATVMGAEYSTETDPRGQSVLESYWFRTDSAWLGIRKRGYIAWDSILAPFPRSGSSILVRLGHAAPPCCRMAGAWTFVFLDSSGLLTPAPVARLTGVVDFDQSIVHKDPTYITERDDPVHWAIGHLGVHEDPLAPELGLIGADTSTAWRREPLSVQDFAAVLVYADTEVVADLKLRGHRAFWSVVGVIRRDSVVGQWWVTPNLQGVNGRFVAIRRR